MLRIVKDVTTIDGLHKQTFVINFKDTKISQTSWKYGTNSSCTDRKVSWNVASLLTLYLYFHRRCSNEFTFLSSVSSDIPSSDQLCFVRRHESSSRASYSVYKKYSLFRESPTEILLCGTFTNLRPTVYLSPYSPNTRPSLTQNNLFSNARPSMTLRPYIGRNEHKRSLF